MATRAIFDSPSQAMNAHWHITVRLSRLVLWSFIAIAHVALLQVVLAALWWTQATPAGVFGALRAWLESKPVAAATALGVSALGLLGLYLKLVRLMHRAAGSGWLLGYLTNGMREGP